MAIQRTSLVDIVIERIKAYILENELQPNDRFLSEKELTDQLQVSRTVVREALISLQTLGIITIKSGGGAYIADSTMNSISTILKHHYDTYGIKIRELIEIREIIELGALRLIIEKDVDVDLDQLTEINDSYYHTIIEKIDTKKYDRLFHQSLIKATENETYYKFSEVIHEYFSLVKIDLAEKEEALIRSFHQHKEIINAIKEKNLSLAHQVMKEHLEPILTFINQMEEDT